MEQTPIVWLLPFLILLKSTVAVLFISILVIHSPSCPVTGSNGTDDANTGDTSAGTTDTRMAEMQGG